MSKMIGKSIDRRASADREHRRPSGPVRFVVLTTSDSRNMDTDESGKLAVRMICAKGHVLQKHEVIPNDVATIRRAVKNLLGGDIRLIITTGGTGCGKRDVTIEAVAPLIKKQLVGFGELFRQLSYRQIRTACIMSRAVLGVSNGCAIVCLPGSTKAVSLALKSVLLPELDHILWEGSRA